MSKRRYAIIQRVQKIVDKPELRRQRVQRRRRTALGERIRSRHGRATNRPPRPRAASSAAATPPSAAPADHRAGYGLPVALCDWKRGQAVRNVLRRVVGVPVPLAAYFEKSKIGLEDGASNRDAAPAVDEEYWRASRQVAMSRSSMFSSSKTAVFSFQGLRPLVGRRYAKERGFENRRRLRF